MSNQPTNSIDSELEEILEAYRIKRMWDEGEMTKAKALQAIHAKYVSRKEIEEALRDEEYQMDKHRPSNEPDIMYKNELRAELRAKLEQLFNEKEK